jgi:hypothetical protein
MKRPEKNNAPWSDEELRIIRECYDRGVSDPRISLVLVEHGFSRRRSEAIRLKRHRIGLTYGPRAMKYQNTVPAPVAPAFLRRVTSWFTAVDGEHEDEFYEVVARERLVACDAMFKRAMIEATMDGLESPVLGTFTSRQPIGPETPVRVVTQMVGDIHAEEASDRGARAMWKVLAAGAGASRVEVSDGGRGEAGRGAGEREGGHRERAAV